jgi:hypothetical protein
MTYWRMQLHPDDSSDATRRTVESLSAGYVGLDFAADVPDLLTIQRDALPANQRNYWAFAHEMKVGDRVLLSVHHFPFALVRISGKYNYIRSKVPELGVWFRHFRSVDEIGYYGDWIKDARKWKRIPMTATVTPLRKQNTKSYGLIEHWMQHSSAVDDPGREESDGKTDDPS